MIRFNGLLTAQHDRDFWLGIDTVDVKTSDDESHTVQIDHLESDERPPERLEAVDREQIFPVGW